MERVNSYYSNCLIEAIRFKLKNVHAVKLLYIPAFLNEVHCPHLMWTDGEYEYDFTSYEALKPYQWLFYKGHIRKRSMETYKKYMHWAVDRKYDLVTIKSSKVLT